MSFVQAVIDWAGSSPIIDGVLFQPPDGQLNLPVCAVAVARGRCGYGKGATQSEALVSTVGEALEQYAASLVDHRRLVRARMGELRGEVFDPQWLCLYTEAQYARPGFPYKTFEETAPLSWIAGRWMDTQEPVWLPAFAVYLSDEFAPEALCQVTSNGLAAGDCAKDAARRAARELYERDAFMASWIAQNGVGPVSMAELDGIESEVMASLRRQGARVEVFLLREETPYVAVCAGFGDGVRWPGVTLGLGASDDCRGAVRKAVMEMGQTGPYLARVWREKRVADVTLIRSLEDHALYYCDPEHAVAVRKWLKPGWVRVRGGGERIAVVDLTPDDLRDSPYAVARAIGKGLQPIHYGYGMERRLTPRIAAAVAEGEANWAPPPLC